MGTAYWSNISKAISTLWKGLELTFRHILQARHTHTKTSIADNRYFDVADGLMTVQYPHESLPVPDNGRYRLHNEIDDCIVCDKCAKICPVDCIEIESIRAVEEFGKTSDGTSKRIHAARFDIDMGKCCFCGLCTTVCPTECLTMTKTYDFSEYDVDDHIYSFATMTPLEILEKKEALERYQKEKEQQAQKKETSAATSGFKPRMKPRVKSPGAEDEAKADAPKPGKPKMKPQLKPRIKPSGENEDKKEDTPGKPKAAKPKMKPRMKPRMKPSGESEDRKEDVQGKAKPAKPVIKPRPKPSSEADETGKERPKYRPKPIIPKKKKDDDE